MSRLRLHSRLTQAISSITTETQVGHRTAPPTNPELLAPVAASRMTTTA